MLKDEKTETAVETVRSHIVIEHPFERCELAEALRDETFVYGLMKDYHRGRINI